MVWCVLQRLLNADLILGEKLKINTPFKAHKQKMVKHYFMLFGSNRLFFVSFLYLDIHKARI